MKWDDNFSHILMNKIKIIIIIRLYVTVYGTCDWPYSPYGNNKMKMACHIYEGCSIQLVLFQDWGNSL